MLSVSEIRKVVTNRIRSVDLSDRQQSRIRLFVAACLTPYFLWYRYVHHAHIPPVIFNLLVLYILYSGFTLASVYLNLPGSKTRRVIFQVADSILICYTMHVGDRVCAPMILAAYWSLIGSGARYGRKFLAFGSAVMCPALLAMVLTTPYWKANWELGLALVFGSAVIPLFFIGNMLKKITDAKEKAEVANITKSRFLSTMSHEFRTPLNGILGSVDLLADTKTDPEQQGLVNTIQASAKILLSLVNDVLDVSKIEEGKVSIVTEEMDLHALVKSIATVISQQVSSKGLRFRMIMAPEVPFQLKGDSTRLRQILANLLSNAVKFTREGEIVVRVMKTGEDERQATVRFEVSDSGIGMTLEQQARIFDRFIQADDSITRKYGGTGLGTTISKELVELMGGKIGVSSRPGKGSTFWFNIPLEKVEAKTSSIVGPLAKPKVVVLSANHLLADRLRDRLFQIGIPDVQILRNGLEAKTYIKAITDTYGVHNILVVVEGGIEEDPLSFSDQLFEEGLRKKVRMVLFGNIDSEKASEHGYRSIIRPIDNDESFRNGIHYVLPSQERQEESVPSPAGNSRSLNVLVAEDNAINQEVIRRVLEKAGHRVRLVDDGVKALHALLFERFDIALLDLNMPEKSGLDTAREYMAQEKENPIPLVALTADATVESRKACVEAGMTEYLTKPLESRKILAVISSVGGKFADAQVGERPAVAPLQEVKESRRSDILIDEEMVRELEMLGSNKDFVKNLVWMFVRDSEKRLKGMESALEHGDAKGFHDLAHALKGIAGSMGALRVMDLANEAQRLPEDAPVSEKRGKCTKLKREIDRVKKSLMRRYGVVDPGDSAGAGSGSKNGAGSKTGADKV